MDTPASNMSTHFQVPKSAVYIMVISFALIMILEVVARTVEYIWPAAPIRRHAQLRTGRYADGC